MGMQQATGGPVAFVGLTFSFHLFLFPGGAQNMDSMLRGSTGLLEFGILTLPSLAQGLSFSICNDTYHIGQVILMSPYQDAILLFSACIKWRLFWKIWRNGFEL